MGAERAKYRVLHELGAGGMGLVWKGLLVGQAGFQRPLVIKQLKHAGDRGHLDLFVQEARRYALLDHENIGRIFDFDRVAGELCIILEYIDGWTLIEYLERHKEQDRRTDVDLCVFMVSRVCRALQYVFERAQIVHRDISPSNIMMTREGTVKLIDFGIATLSGTRDHAPEMVTEMRTDNRSDLFSLGAVLYELLCGERLFRALTTAAVLEKVVSAPIFSVRNLRPDIPEAVEAIVRRALHRDPSLRFASAADMGEACEHHLYDKGYGPTNLTLKRYVARLFPEAEPAASEATFPLVESTFLPIFDRSQGRSTPQAGLGADDDTPVAPAHTGVVTRRSEPFVRPEKAARTLPVATMPLADLARAEARHPAEPAPQAEVRKARASPAKPRARRGGSGSRAKAGARRRAR